MFKETSRWPWRVDDHEEAWLLLWFVVQRPAIQLYFGKSLMQWRTKSTGIAAQDQQDTDNGLPTHRQRTILLWRYVVLVALNDDQPLNLFFRGFNLPPSPSGFNRSYQARCRPTSPQCVWAGYSIEIDGWCLHLFREHCEEQKAGLCREREGWPPN